MLQLVTSNPAESNLTLLFTRRRHRGWGGAVGGGGLMEPHADLGAGQLGHGDDRDAFEPRQVGI